MTYYPLDNNFDYHAPDDVKKVKHEATRQALKITAAFILEQCPESRERSVALTKLEEVMFWANASIARN